MWPLLVQLARQECVLCKFSPLYCIPKFPHRYHRAKTVANIQIFVKKRGGNARRKTGNKSVFFLCFFAHDFFSYVFRFCSFRFISALWILCVDKCCCMIRSGNEVLVDIYYSSLRRLRGPKGWRRIIHRKEPNARKPMGGFTKIGSFNCILVPFDLVCDTV